MNSQSFYRCFSLERMKRRHNCGIVEEIIAETRAKRIQRQRAPKPALPCDTGNRKEGPERAVTGYNFRPFKCLGGFNFSP